MEIANDFLYQYAKKSEVKDLSDAKDIQLAHCSELEDNAAIPCYFYGNIKDSFIAARCLNTLSQTVKSHFAIAPNVIAKLRDPIISVGNKTIRFEAFSSCNSVYTRVDILETGIDGEFLHAGCTNVDFNDATNRAFQMIQANEKLFMGIGSNDLQIKNERQSIVEQKVALPNRWIKGLANVQVYLEEMEEAFIMNKVELLHLFRTVPKAPSKADYFFGKSGAQFNFSPSEKPNSIKVGGVHRLNLLSGLIQFCNKGIVYKNASGQSFAIVLDFKNIQMLFLFSDSVYRDFSGEGKQLEFMTDEIPNDLILGVNQFFKTNEVINPSLIAIESDLNFKHLSSIQSRLASIGLLGFDLMNNQYYYRRLPFKLDRLMSLNPRLKNANLLVAKSAITIIEKQKNYTKAQVKGSSGVFHTVIKSKDTYQCTCNWYSQHKINRGLCKHILALKIFESE